MSMTEALPYIDLLRDFAITIGVPEVDTFIATGELRVDDLVLSFCPEGEDARNAELWMFSAFTPPAHLSAAELNQILLEANWFWHGTGGATFSLNPETDEVLFAARILRSGLSGEQLGSLCAQFVDTLLEWRAMLLTPARAKHFAELDFTDRNDTERPHA